MIKENKNLQRVNCKKVGDDSKAGKPRLFA